MNELNTRFEVNGICYAKLTENTVAVTKRTLKYSGSVTIPESVIYNDINYSVTEIGESAFRGCDGLTSVIIPDSVTEIGESAFRGCDGLTSVVIPDSVAKIGDFAFIGCGELTSIDVDSGNTMYCSCEGVVYSKDMKTLLICPEGKQGSFDIPDSVTEIGRYAFDDCRGLTSINIPDSVTEIGDGAFCDCSGLTSVIIHSSVTKIGVVAFAGCSELTSINVDSGNSMYCSYEGVVYSKDMKTLLICPEAKQGSFDIPDSVTEIGVGAFAGCRGLTSVSISDSVTEIGRGAFRECSRLTSIRIPDSVTEIGRGAFRECSRLTSVIIPDSVTKIGEYAFEGCSGLKRIYIGANVSELGNESFSDVFEGCELIEDISVAAVVPPEANEDIFDESVYAKATLRVPEAAIESYKSQGSWSKFSTIKPLVKQ